MGSAEFNVSRGWSKKTVVNDEDYYQIEFEDSSITEEDKEFLILFMPIKGDNYRKRLIEAAFNILTKISCDGALSNNKKDYASKLNENDINLEFIFMMKTLINFTGYFINSTSWKEQDLKEFDRSELEKRLQKVIHYFKSYETETNNPTEAHH